MSVLHMVRGAQKISSGGNAANDTFDRTNSSSTLGTSSGGGTWTAHAGTWGIASNKGYLVSQSGDSVASINTGSATQDVSLDYTRDTGDDLGLVFRTTDDQNYLLALLSSSGGAIDLYSRVGGSYNLLGSAVVSTGNSGTLRATASGNTLNVYLNAALVIGPITSSDQNTATRVGLRQNSASSATARFDNLVVV